MNLIENKPYVWLEKNKAGLFVLKIRVLFTDGFGTTSERITPIPDKNRLIIKIETFEVENLHIDCGDIEAEESPTTKICYTLDSGSRFDPDVHELVTVVIANSDGVQLGLQTVKPLRDQFQTLGSDPQVKPHMFLKYTDSAEYNVYALHLIPEDAILDDIVEPDYSDPESGSITITFKYKSNDLTVMKWETSEFHLTRDGGFDPIIDDINVVIDVISSSGTGDKKGTGTTHTSEGDASGDD